jgi:hypothetical protein
MTRIVAVLGVAALAIGILAGCGQGREEASELQGRVEATASIDREEIAFGDDLTLTVEVRADPAFEIDLPRRTEFDGFRLIDSGSTRSEARGVLTERRWLRLRAEQAGEQTLPALDVRYRPASAGGAKNDASGTTLSGAGGEWETVSTAPISFEVRSLLPAGDEPPAIREIKPLQPIHRPRPWLWISIAIAVVLALGALLAWWWRRRQSAPKSEPKAPPLPAHVVALAALERLAASDPMGDAAVRRFYFALSEVVRVYIEGRFGLNATDLTSEEILRSLHRLELGEANALGLRAFLADTDAVKFAAQRPQRSEIGAILGWARGFVEATRQVEPEPSRGEPDAREAA